MSNPMILKGGVVGGAVWQEYLEQVKAFWKKIPYDVKYERGAG